MTTNDGYELVMFHPPSLDWKARAIDVLLRKGYEFKRQAALPFPMTFCITDGRLYWVEPIDPGEEIVSE